MEMGKYKWDIVFYLAVFLFVVYMKMNDQSLFWILGVVLTATLIMFTIRIFYPLGWETRMDRVEAFLRRQENTPKLYIYYALANRLDDELEHTIERIRNEDTNKRTQAVYNAAYGSYRNDLVAVRTAVQNMRRSDYRTYYETYLLMEEGRSEQAREHLKSINKVWMRSSLLAAIELKAGQRETAIQLLQEAMDAVRGVHRYMIFKEAERY